MGTIEKQLEFGSEHGFPERKSGEVKTVEPKEEETEGAELYERSLIFKKLEKRRERDKTPFVLFSDIDRTFYHEGALDDMQKLGHGLENADMGLVLVTGRRDTNKNLGNLPTPDVLVQAAGSEIYIRTDDGLILDEAYAHKISERWEREKIMEYFHAFLENKKWQERVKLPDQESKWEVVSFFTGTEAKVKAFVSELESHLLGLSPESKLKVTYWENHNPKPGSFNFFVGIVPENAGKVEAIKHLQESLDIKDGLVAGDSRIDSDMLLNSGLPAVIVGESRQSLIKEATSSSEPLLFKEVRELPEGQWVYFAPQRKKSTRGAGGIITALKTGMFSKKDVLEDLVKKL